MCEGDKNLQEKMLCTISCRKLTVSAAVANRFLGLLIPFDEDGSVVSVRELQSLSSSSSNLASNSDCLASILL